MTDVPSIINCHVPAIADVVLLAAGYDRTSSYGKGARHGAAATLRCLDRQVEFYEPMTRSSPAERLRIAEHHVRGLARLAPKTMVERVAMSHGLLADAGKFVLTLGGDHSITNGPLLAFSARERPEDVTVFQIDAHFDLRQDDSDFRERPYGVYSHACVMRRAADLGYRVVHVGVRAYSREELEFARERRHGVFLWDDAYRPPITDIVDAIPTKKVYVTVDVDGIDPSHMPATGTPVPGGLEWWFALRLLRTVFDRRQVIGADLVEVAPRKGDALTEWAAAALAYKMIAFHAEQKHRRP